MHASPQERGSSCKPAAGLSSRTVAETVNPAPCRTFPNLKSLRFACAAFLSFFITTHLPAAAESRANTPRLALAAASNLVYVLDDLLAAFRQTHPDLHPTLSTGASGSLVAQIRHGSPVDVFLSADHHYAQALVDSRHAVASSFTTFATGRLVLWTTRDSLALDSLPATVRDPAVRKLALANPDTAPYGRATKQVLATLDLWTDAAPKMVLGENITQTAQFVETGHADAGFVALSLVLSPRLKNRGRWLEIPAHLHSPLDQAAVLTPRGSENPAAHLFLNFLRSDPAREILLRHGYAVPQKKP